VFNDGLRARQEARLGLKHFAVLSDGRKIASPRFLRRAEKNLKRSQRDLSRKEKGSRNREKA
jgi:putative transposase